MYWVLYPVLWRPKALLWKERMAAIDSASHGADRKIVCTNGHYTQPPEWNAETRTVVYYWAESWMKAPDAYKRYWDWWWRRKSAGEYGKCVLQIHLHGGRHCIRRRKHVVRRIVLHETAMRILWAGGSIGTKPFAGRCNFCVYMVTTL